MRAGLFHIILLAGLACVGLAGFGHIFSAKAGEVVGPEQREYWAFQRLSHVNVPEVRAREKMRTPVDAFLLSKLEARGLSFGPESSRSVLARRAYFDLIGLPPSPEELAQFLDDSVPGAYERLIARLLASPHFGERWGRHWLDVAGYVDTPGDDTDAGTGDTPKNKFLFRDYVVRAFNEDKPFNRFILEQIAGDELVDWRNVPAFTPEIKDLLVATGFLRTAADKTSAPELNTVDIRHAVVGQQVEIVTNCLLGVTFNCARCHSHKYDPIPQEDYYRMLAVFTPVYNVENWLTPDKREVPDVAPAQKAEIEKCNGRIDSQVAAQKAGIEAIEQPQRERIFSQRLESVPGEIRQDVRAALSIAEGKRDGVQKYLAGKFQHLPEVKAEEVAATLTAEQRTNIKQMRDEIGRLESGRRSIGALQVAYDTGPPPQTRLLVRGNYLTPGKVVPAGYLRVLCDSESDSLLEDSHPYAGTSGRRLALAHWLTNPQGRAGALAARVYVNRAWQHLFGSGIVATPGNFGHSGTRPTHPELLEWMAGEFIANGYHLKPLLTMLMTSNAYRQSSLAARETATGANPESVDPGNDLLWHMPLRQLESEAVRDSILAVSGKLDSKMGGPPEQTESRPDGFVVVQSSYNQYRRSLYLLARRRYHLSLLDAFGQPEMSTNCPERRATVVVSQSLALLNDAFLFEQADAFAWRVEREIGDAEPGAQIDHAFQLALARTPSSDERNWASELLDQQRKRYAAGMVTAGEAEHKALSHLCHMLLSTNEFLYVQ